MKYDLHSNHKFLAIPGIDALRKEAVDESAAPNVAAQMLSMSPVLRHRPRFAMTIAAAVAAALLGAAVLLPRTARAVPLREVDQAISEHHSWYEQTFRPDSSGKLQLVIESWTTPEKSAYLERKDGMIDAEGRCDGKLTYQYYTHGVGDEHQRITPWKSEPFPLSTVKSFEQFRLLAVRPEGKLLRYVFAIHQDLLVDPDTKLPIERDVYLPDGRILEIHKIFVTEHIDAGVFKANIKPGVPLADVPGGQAAINSKLAEAPQKRTVGGVQINLYAVIIQDIQRIGAVVVGGNPRPEGAPEHIQIVGLTAPETRSMFDYDPWPGDKRPLIIGGKVARIERAGWLQRPSIPDHFMLRVPVWGARGKFAGWAEFNVADPIRAESIEEVLPNFVPPGVMATKSTGSAETKP